ncbi:MAG: GGDEF domain-containing protein [Phycisphaerales bacterium]|nr:GGDEF domain-containing protein [Phycisphaerales bacterium]
MPVINETLNLRVILAGRTGLEAQLRKDPGIELIRTRTAFECLGELSEPIDAESPDRCVVIVGTDVAKTVVSRELTHAIKHLKPDAIALLAIDGGGQDPSFDGTISPSADAAILRDVLGQRVGGGGGGGVSKSRGKALGKRAAVPVAGADEGEWREVPLPTELTGAQAIIADEPTPVARPRQNGGVLPQAPRITQQVMFMSEPTPGQPVPPRQTEILSAPARIAPPQAPVAPAPVSVPMPAATYQSTGRVMAPAQALPADAAMLGGGGVGAAAGPATQAPRPMLTAPHVAVAVAAWHEDRAMLSAVMDDQDAIEAGLNVIRRRLGRADVRYTSGNVEPGTAFAPVSHHGRPLGYLLSVSGAAQVELAEAGVWLGQWIALQQIVRDAKQAAITDELTGAFNRRYLDRFLDQAIAQSAQRRNMLSVMVFDIDHFKTFNDRYGHAAGDEILVETVKLLRSVIRPDDRVCRVGGDEFVVVFYEPAGPREANTRHPQSIEAVAERFRKQIAEHRFPKLGADAIGKLTISAGLATFPWDGRTGKELLTVADSNLYRAKREGRNALVFGK